MPAPARHTTIPFPSPIQSNNRHKPLTTPESLEAEQSTLGAMMLEREAIARALAIVGETDFYRELHRRIFVAVVTLFEKNRPIDMITVTEELRRRGQLEEIGGVAYLSALIDACPSTASVESYAKVVSEKSRLRRALEITNILQSQVSYIEGGNEAEILGAAIAQLQALQERAKIESGDGKAEITNFATLLQMQFPEPKWVIPNILPAGASILAGKPKLGKSWLTLGIALATALGGTALGSVPVEAGDVLYLALEDNNRRLQSRGLKLMDGSTLVPDRLEIATEWPSQDSGGMELLEQWLKEHGEARLIVIDTFEKFRTRSGKSGNIYAEDYDAISPLKKLADEYGVAILIVHHTSKAGHDDTVAEVSGSYGLTGSADGILVLNRKRNSGEGSIKITGRDIGEDVLPLKFDETLGLWSIDDRDETARSSTERDEILQVLLDADEAVKPTEIAQVLNKQPGQVRSLLWKMAKAGQVKKDPFGGYLPENINGINASTPSTHQRNMQQGYGCTTVDGVDVDALRAPTDEAAILEHARSQRENIGAMTIISFVRYWDDNYDLAMSTDAFDKYFDEWMRDGEIKGEPVPGTGLPPQTPLFNPEETTTQ